eukprot:6207558-Pleurochrysis_carterae.AAC.2
MIYPEICRFEAYRDSHQPRECPRLGRRPSYSLPLTTAELLSAYRMSSHSPALPTLCPPP